MKKSVPLEKILNRPTGIDERELREFALDSFSRAVDDQIQKELMTKLVLDYSAIAIEIEKLNRELRRKKNQLEKYNKRLNTLVDEKVKEISEAQLATIYGLIKLSEARDNETGYHVERTSEFCGLLAEKTRENGYYNNEINDVFIKTIVKAAPLHDIGKVGVSDNILLKPKKLTDEEMTTMRSHVIIGYGALSQVQAKYKNNEFINMGLEISRYHHEKWDGSGYLEGLKGEDIPLAARIMAIADVYDALRSERPYKKAFSHKKSLEMIKEGAGKHFDPVLVKVLVKENLAFEDLYEKLKEL